MLAYMPFEVEAIQTDQGSESEGTVGLGLEIQIWAGKRFQGILKSPENAFRDQSQPKYRLNPDQEPIDEH